MSDPYLGMWDRGKDGRIESCALRMLHSQFRKRTINILKIKSASRKTDRIDNNEISICRTLGSGNNDCPQGYLQCGKQRKLLKLVFSVFLCFHDIGSASSNEAIQNMVGNLVCSLSRFISDDESCSVYLSDL